MNQDVESFDIRDVRRGQPAQGAGVPLAGAAPGAGAGGGGGPRPNAGAPLGACTQYVWHNPKQCCGICLVSMILVLGLVLVSIASVAPTEYGLRYNRFSKSVDGGYVYRGGRHLIGPWGSLMSFPATRQNVEFSTRAGAQSGPLSTRTQEGLSLRLHIVFQYRLIQDKVPVLYKLAASNYEVLFMKVARDVLLKSAAHYNAPQYWTDRDRIGKEMHDLVNRALVASYAECPGLQIMVIELPDQYEQSIVATQVQKQQIKTKENEQKATYIRAQIGVMVANYNRNITVTLAGANADAMRVTQSAEAEAQQKKIDAENVALKGVKDDLNLTASGLVGYQRALALQQMPSSTFLYGVQNPVVVLGASAPAPAPAPGPTQFCASGLAGSALAAASAAAASTSALSSSSPLPSVVRN
mmetsp:Transcript_38386/g.99301  ORF Transcript_38386/g.99301 Transcript_38386/m.99301 type:complete len:412 (-) Transcript_38386:44-1279(-)